MPQAAPVANPKSISLTVPLELAAGEGGADALPVKFSGTAYSGGRVPAYGVVIDVDTTEVPKKMPLLMEHQRQNIIGVIDAGEKSGAKIIVAGKLFSDMTGGDAERVAKLSQRGAPYQMSVGLFGYTEEYIPAGQSATVNGELQQGPVVILRNGRVRECSIVTLGADPNTDAQFFSMPDGLAAGAPATSPAKASTMTPEQIAALQAENIALKAANEAATAAAAALKLSQRTADTAALFAEVGQKPTAEQTAAFAAMDDASFAAASAAMKATGAQLRKLNPALFTDTATGDTTTTQAPGAKQVNLSAPSIYEARRKAAATAVDA
jgi:hypothetical protein